MSFTGEGELHGAVSMRDATRPYCQCTAGLPFDPQVRRSHNVGLLGPVTHRLPSQCVSSRGPSRRSIHHAVEPLDDAGGLGEAVSDGESGLLVEPENVAALGAALDKLLADESLRQQMGAAGRARMQNEFSIATMAAKHVALYETVIHG